MNLYERMSAKQIEAIKSKPTVVNWDIERILRELMTAYNLSDVSVYVAHALYDILVTAHVPFSLSKYYALADGFPENIEVNEPEEIKKQ